MTTEEELKLLREEYKNLNTERKLESEAEFLRNKIEELKNNESNKRKSNSYIEMFEYLKEKGYLLTFVLFTAGIWSYIFGSIYIPFPLEAIGVLCIAGGIMFSPFFRENIYDVTK